jgi:hypothetical protein
MVTTDTSQNTGTGLTIGNTTYQNTMSINQATSVMITESPLTNFGFQLPTGKPQSMYEIEIPQSEGIKVGTQSTLGDAMAQQPIMQSTVQSPQTSAVNRNVQSNELAGAVDLASMAQQPTGYQTYFGAMPDVAFYAPKEIYKNQVNVDNARVLRGLGSDRLHQQLINMQYK